MDPPTRRYLARSNRPSLHLRLYDEREYAVSNKKRSRTCTVKLHRRTYLLIVCEMKRMHDIRANLMKPRFVQGSNGNVGLVDHVDLIVVSQDGAILHYFLDTLLLLAIQN